MDSKNSIGTYKPKRAKKSQSPLDKSKRNLKAPPKTIAANSIVVKIGDFKAQGKLDQEQMKEMEKKKQKRLQNKSKTQLNSVDKNVEYPDAVGS